MSTAEAGLPIVDMSAGHAVRIPTMELSRKLGVAILLGGALLGSASRVPGGLPAVFDGSYLGGGTPQAVPSAPQAPTTIKSADKAKSSTGSPCESWIAKPGAAAKAVAAAKQTAQASVVTSGVSPGAAVAVGCGNSLVSAFTVGVSGDAEPLSAKTTKYDLASLTKIFTAAGMLKLQDEGRVNLADPIGKSVGNPYTQGVKASVTYEMGLRHLTGLAGHESYTKMLNVAHSSAAMDRYILDEPLKHAPGTTTNYSNYAVQLDYIAGTNITGKPFNQYIAEKILDPLGMANTSYLPTDGRCAPTSPDDDQSATLVCVHQDRFARAKLGNLGPAGAFASVTDEAKFLGMLAAGGKVANTTILSEAAIAEMWKPHYAANTMTPDSIYGVGVHLNLNNGLSAEESPQAFGGEGWSGTAFTVDPKTGIYSVVLTNASFHKKLVEGRDDDLGYNLNRTITDRFLSVLKQ